MTSDQTPARTFVDTNILVYAHSGQEIERRQIAAAALDLLWQTRSGILSTQVLQEFYVVATRKLDPPMPRPVARHVVASYAAWPVVGIDPPLIIAASLLEETHTIAFWDALIVESARRGGATLLMSEDLQTGRKFGELMIVNPFAPIVIGSRPPRNSHRVATSY